MTQGSHSNFFWRKSFIFLVSPLHRVILNLLSAFWSWRLLSFGFLWCPQFHSPESDAICRSSGESRPFRKYSVWNGNFRVKTSTANSVHRSQLPPWEAHTGDGRYWALTTTSFLLTSAFVVSVEMTVFGSTIQVHGTLICIIDPLKVSSLWQDTMPLLEQENGVINVWSLNTRIYGVCASKK